MRTDTYAKVVLTVIFASACAAYGQIGRASAASNGGQQMAGTRSSGNSTLPANADAQKAAQFLWDTILTKCGGSCYYVSSKLNLTGFGDNKLHFNDGSIEPLILNDALWQERSKIWHELPPTHIWEFKNVIFRLSQKTVRVSPESPYPARPYVEAVIWVESWRERELPHEWSGWNSGSNLYNDGHAAINISKNKDGEWFFGGVSAADITPRNKPSCSSALQSR
jgi:hypothetical protein